MILRILCHFKGYFKSGHTTVGQQILLFSVYIKRRVWFKHFEHVITKDKQTGSREIRASIYNFKLNPFLFIMSVFGASSRLKQATQSELITKNKLVKLCCNLFLVVKSECVLVR